MTIAGQEVTAESLRKQLPSLLPELSPCSDLPELPAPSSDAISQRLFPDFRSQDLKTSGATIRVLTKGGGAPLLLVHGHPETHATWHKIADAEERINPRRKGYQIFCFSQKS